MNRSKRIAAAAVTAFCIHAALFFLVPEFVPTDGKTANSSPGSVTVTLSKVQPPAPSAKSPKKTRVLPTPERSDIPVPDATEIPHPKISTDSAAEPVPVPDSLEEIPPSSSAKTAPAPDAIDIPAPAFQPVRAAEIEPLPDFPKAKQPPDTAEPVAEQKAAPDETGRAAGDGEKHAKENARSDSAESEDGTGQKKIHRATPLYKSNPLPRYPSSARRRGFEGTVRLLVEVSEKGEVTELEVDRSSGYPSLDRRAVETVKDWKFEPGRINGEAAAVKVKIPVTFRLE